MNLFIWCVCQEWTHLWGRSDHFRPHYPNNLTMAEEGQDSHSTNLGSFTQISFTSLALPSRVLWCCCAGCQCGCGVWLHVDQSCQYKIHWNGAPGTNMRAEVLALWGLLWFSGQLSIDTLFVYEDSQVLIEGLSANTEFTPPHLTAWISQINILWGTSSSISLQHIFREKNWVADSLSKKGITENFGYMHYTLLEADTIGTEGTIPLP